MPLILLGSLCLVSTGCVPGSGRTGSGARVKMTLISNQENTTFRIRRPGGSWRTVGKAKIVDVRVDPGSPYEVRAKSEGYVAKTLTIRKPVRELRFTFEIRDREGAAPAGLVEVDVRAVAVSSGRLAAAAKGTAEGWTRLREAVDRAAASLAGRPHLRGKLLAVLEFSEGAGAAGLGRQAHGMLVTELNAGGRVLVVERDRLRAILQEHDLSESDVVANPRVLGKISQIDYIVLGVVSRLKE